MNGRTMGVAGVVAAALLALGVQVAAAQPGGHGHGPGRGGFGIEQMLSAVEGKLSLNTSQKLMWDNAVAQSKAAREAGRANFAAIRTALNAELAKAEPDFAAVAAVTDDAHAKNHALRNQARDEWLKLYATFSPAQKAVVKDAMTQKLARFDSFRERMKERMQSRSSGTGS